MSGQREYIFFTDRDLGKQFPEILERAGINVKRHFEYFADDTKDAEWLTVIGRRGWYALTHNRRIRYTPNEIAAVKKFNIGLFVIIGKRPYPELARNFVYTLPQIVKFIQKTSRPFIAKIYHPYKHSRKLNLKQSGYVKLWVSFD